MRLLDVHSVTEEQLPVFHELLENGASSPLRYAILSHTWGKHSDNQNIVFDDIPSSETFARFVDETTQLKQWRGAINKKKAGFSKITNACRIAHGMDLDYIWIDSCCIDKSKSAELNESINSMYRWYQNSERCIAYLEDLEPDGDLRQCRWFKRGWTLQELVAPSKVIFYDTRWAPFGDKTETRLCELLSSITGIDMECLQNGGNIGAMSTAHKMSWAAGRETTVPEDRAYSLMGIFDVNMPLIYGEGGSKAFGRLQEEISKVSSDVTIFAWDPPFQASTGMDAFASSPDGFTEYKDMLPSFQSKHFMRTNKGIAMDTKLWQVRCDDGKERLMLAIGKQKNGKLDIGIILRKVGQNMYVRRGNMRRYTHDQITSSTGSSAFYLVSPHGSLAYDKALGMSRERAILIPADGLRDFHIWNPVPQQAWDCEERLFFDNRHWGGSDWRAIEVVYTGLEPECSRRFIALFALNDTKPDCYLLRWEEKLAFIFDRWHKMTITKLEDFRHIIGTPANEVDIGSSGDRLSIRLFATTTDEHSGMQFRMELHRVASSAPGIPDPKKPTTNNSGPRVPFINILSKDVVMVQQGSN